METYRYMPDEKPKEKPTKSVGEIAQELGLSKQTVYAYIRDGIFTNQEYFIVQRPERVRYVFFADAVQTYLDRNRPQLQSEERPKRTYNKRSVKGKHSSKGKKSA